MLSQKSESVKVLIRCRPFNRKELVNRSNKCIEIQKLNHQCSLKLTSPKKYRRRLTRLFRFDAIYNENHRTEEIFQDFIQPLVCDATLHGYSGTVFAYGQTGSGKSWTMTGCPCHSEQGLIANAIEHVFNLVDHYQSNYEQEQNFLIKCAYLEIYNEELHDLLLPRHSNKSHSRIELRENPRSSSVHITNLTWKNVSTIDECMKYKRFGDLARTMGSTQMNRDSSRSHTMFSISIQIQENNSKEIFRQGKLNFVDLAGSERQLKSGASGQQLIESAKINLSLSALNKVISSLVQAHTTHIPYRDSKLTRLLQDSIGGTTKTIMIACISPSEDNYEETLCTLRYASRTKNIRNTPIINETSSHAFLHQYAEEIQRLRDIINSSNKHMQSLSHSLISNDVKQDDQHSLKTISNHQVSSETSPSIKCQRTVSCQTMSIQIDTTNSSTQNEDQDKEVILLYDENQLSYQILAWHSCQSTQQLTLLVKENKTENYWLGTLTTINQNDLLLWINNLNQRQYKFHLSKQTDSIITHFGIQQSIYSLILYTSSSYMIINNNICFSETPIINNHFITLKETSGRIYYLCDILQTISSNELLVFLIDSFNHYQIHHFFFNEKNSFENFQHIQVEHCCCLNNNNNQLLQTNLISSSHFLSFINMFCEIEHENHIKKSNIHFIDFDTHIIH